MMIRGVNGSQYITVMGGQPSSMPYVNQSALSSGSLRYNPGTLNMEVYDGNSWVTIYPSTANIDVPDWVKATLDWAHQRMLDERKMEYYCAKYPGLEKARDNFEMFKKFVQAQEEANNSVTDGEVTAGP